MMPIVPESAESYEASAALYEVRAKERRAKRIDHGDVAFAAFIFFLIVVVGWALYRAAERDQSPDGWNRPAQVAAGR